MHKSLHPTWLFGLLWADNRGCQRTALDIHTAKVPVLSPSTIITLTGQTEDTQMPISAVARGASREGTSSLDEHVVTC